MINKRIAALLLVFCLLSLTGCVRREPTAILCIEKASVAAEQLCSGDGDLSYALATDDAAILQQLESEQCEFALVTKTGWETARENQNLEKLADVTLSQFAILSREGSYAQWGRTTRVTVVGEVDGDADVLAQQVLSCALHGTVRYLSWEEALTALKKKRTEVVMGFAAPEQENLVKALKKIKNLEILSMPESLVSIRLPDDTLTEKAVTYGDQTAQSYVLYGTLICSAEADEEAQTKVLTAAQKASLVQEDE